MIASTASRTGRYGAGWPGALGQVLACLAHRDARPAGGGADVGDRREQGVLPEVVGLPPGDLIKQVRFGPAMEGCCGQHCVLELGVSRPRKVRSGRNRSRSLAKGSGSARLALHQFSASAARWRNTSPGKVLSRGCKRRKLAHQLEDVSVAGEPVEQDTAGGHGVLGGRPLPGRHITTVGQNHRSPGGLTGGCPRCRTRGRAGTSQAGCRRLRGAALRSCAGTTQARMRTVVPVIWESGPSDVGTKGPWSRRPRGIQCVHPYKFAIGE